MMTRGKPRSWRSVLYLIVGLAIVALWGATAAFGIEGDSGKVERLPADVRTAPGGYRSFHFWHSGYRGGK